MFASNQVKFTTNTTSVQSFLNLMEKGELAILNTNFDELTQSQIIESMLLRIPFSTIYLDELNDRTYQVLDGNKVMTALHNFVFGNLKLQGLDILTHLEGKMHNEITPECQRIIANTKFECATMYWTMPEELKNLLKKRIVK